MQKILVALSLTVLAACGPAPQLPPFQVRALPDTAEPGEDPYAAGKRHLAAGQLGLAIEQFRATVAKNRADIAAMNALASCYDRLGRFDLADRYYQQALALAPADMQTLNNIGVSNLMRGRAAPAATMLELARKSAPDDTRVAANLARATQAVAQLQAAEAAYAEEQAERPNRIERTSMNAWALRTGAWLQPAVWVKPSMSQGVEPPPPVAAPRPVVTRVALDATAAAPAASPGNSPAALRILNGAGRRGMAARMRARLASHGLAAIGIADAPRFDVRDSVLSYLPGRQAEAAKLATRLPPGVRLELVHDQHHDLQLVLGRDLIPFDLSH